MTYKQDPPFAVQVELTEGCNLWCNFCGIQGIRKQPGKFKYLTVRKAMMLAAQIRDAGWTSRIEFAMHGEPTMNPNHTGIIHVFREALPRNQLMMTSNGGGLLPQRDVVDHLEQLFDAGLNVFALDAYEYVNIAPKVRAAIDAHPDTFRFNRYEYPRDSDASPHKRWPRSTRALIFVQDISVAAKGNHSILNNHCGHGAPLNHDADGARCAKPFREMAVRWNGKIAICCNTWAGHYVCGDIGEHRIDVIWQNKQFRIARKHLYHGMREFAPCQGCDAKSYRVGLLPDKKGVIDLPKPTSAERKYAQEHGVKTLTRGKAVKWRND